MQKINVLSLFDGISAAAHILKCNKDMPSKQEEAITDLALDLLKNDKNIPVDQKQDSCMFYANKKECGLSYPISLDDNCPIKDEITELDNGNA